MTPKDAATTVVARPAGNPGRAHRPRAHRQAGALERSRPQLPQHPPPARRDRRRGAAERRPCGGADRHARAARPRVGLAAVAATSKLPEFPSGEVHVEETVQRIGKHHRRHGRADARAHPACRRDAIPVSQDALIEASDAAREASLDAARTARLVGSAAACGRRGRRGSSKPSTRAASFYAVERIGAVGRRQAAIRAAPPRFVLRGGTMQGCSPAPGRDPGGTAPIRSTRWNDGARTWRISVGYVRDMWSSSGCRRCQRGFGPLLAPPSSAQPRARRVRSGSVWAASCAWPGRMPA